MSGVWEVWCVSEVCGRYGEWSVREGVVCEWRVCGRWCEWRGCGRCGV